MSHTFSHPFSSKSGGAIAPPDPLVPTPMIRSCYDPLTHCIRAQIFHYKSQLVILMHF